MPSLHIFGRRWSISSDDFVFPEITEGLIRLVWFIVSFIIYVTRTEGDTCLNLHLFLIIALVTNSIVIAMCIATAYISSLGTIRIGSVRQNLSILLYARCPLILFEVAWNITGGVLATIIGGWLMLLVLVIGTVINFDPLGNIHHGDVKMTDEAKKIWKYRIHLACICGSNSDQAKMAFEEVAELFVDLFSETDLVWTDVWAAMLLLASKELRVLNERSRHQVDEDAPLWMNIRAASQVMRFALGVYGWPYYLIGRGCSPTVLYDLTRRGRCCASVVCRCGSAVVIKDNCCMCSTAALLVQTGVQETDLFYVNLHNELWETPFVACFDHSTKSIVISIRGSLSMRDAITDLTTCADTLELNSCLPKVETVQTASPRLFSFSNPNRTPSISSEPDYSASQCIKCHAHRGMLLSARYVASKFESEHILEDMFVLQPRYDLVLTGHSLGAGVATLLGVMLKPRYPGLKCYAFSPPGCVISETGAEFTKSFVYSVLWGDDLIPRLSIDSVKNLQQNVLDVLANCDRPKYSILLKGCYKVLCSPDEQKQHGAGTSTVSSDDSRPSSPLTVSPTVPPTPVVEQPLPLALSASSSTFETSNYVDGATRANVNSGDMTTVTNGDALPLLVPGGKTRWYTDEQVIPSQKRCKLVCPGRIMHVRRLRDRYSVHWTHADCLNQIRMSSSMLSDHMPYTVLRVLTEYIAQLNGEPHSIL